MPKRNFLIFEELNILASEVDLLKSITKYAPRTIATDFLEFSKLLIEKLPKNFYANPHVTLCSTNKLSYLNMFKEKFNNCVWQEKEIVVRVNKRKSRATVYYYIDTNNNNLVMLVYTEDFNLKQQALPYCATI